MKAFTKYFLIQFPFKNFISKKSKTEENYSTENLFESSFMFLHTTQQFSSLFSPFPSNTKIKNGIAINIVRALLGNIERHLVAIAPINVSVK